MSWEFVCPSCGGKNIEEDENFGIGSCENSDCSAFGKNVAAVMREPEKAVMPASTKPASDVVKDKNGLTVNVTLNLNL